MDVLWWRPLWLFWSLTSCLGNLFRSRAGQFLPRRARPGVVADGGVCLSSLSPPTARLRQSSLLPARDLPLFLAGQLRPCRAGPSPSVVDWAGSVYLLLPSFPRPPARFPVSRRCPGRLVAYARWGIPVGFAWAPGLQVAVLLVPAPSATHHLLHLPRPPQPRPAVGPLGTGSRGCRIVRRCPAWGRPASASAAPRLRS